LPQRLYLNEAACFPANLNFSLQHSFKPALHAKKKHHQNKFVHIFHLIYSIGCAHLGYDPNLITQNAMRRYYVTRTRAFASYLSIASIARIATFHLSIAASYAVSGNTSRVRYCSKASSDAICIPPLGCFLEMQWYSGTVYLNTLPYDHTLVFRNVPVSTNLLTTHRSVLLKK